MNAATTTRTPALRGKLSVTMKTLAATGALPTLPNVAHAALEAARATDVDTDRVCQIIRTDVGLAAGILRLANSVVYARRTQTKTLRNAVLTIGLRKTCDIMVASGARQVFGAAGAHATALWNHALAVGLAAEALAAVTGSPDGGGAFLSGLFHDVGRIALFVADASGFDDLKIAADAGEHHARERERYGMDHAEIGAALTEGWGLAPSQSLAVRWHHEPENSSTGQSLATLVNAADAIAYTLGLGFGAMPPENVLLTRLGLSPEAEASCVARVGETFAHYVELLSA